MSARHVVQGLALDELHGVIANPVVVAVIEDAHDVRVVQPGRQRGPRRGTAASISGRPGTADARP